MEKKNMEKVGIFSFFAGAGFLDLGFEHSEIFDVVFVNEIRSSFVEAYQHSRQKMGIPLPEFGFQNCDILDFGKNLHGNWLDGHLGKAREKYSAIGFIGGPPCPDFSIAGKNRGENGENGKLSGAYIDLICQKQPDFFLFENVKGLYRTKKHRQFFDSLKEKLASSGYLLSERLINAIEYGAPQDRDRIILIGVRRDRLRFDNIEAKSLDLLGFDWKKAMQFDRDVVFSKDWPRQDNFVQGSVTTPPKELPLELTVGHWFKKNKVESHPNSKHYFQPRAGLVKFLSIPEGDDKKKSYKRLHRWRYSPTAAYGNNEVHLHPWLARRISAAEALSIQSLPASFELPASVSLSDMFKMIGNGVPYLAALGLAKTIENFILENDLLKNSTRNVRKTVRKQSGKVYCPA